MFLGEVCLELASLALGEVGGREERSMIDGEHMLSVFKSVRDSGRLGEGDKALLGGEDKSESKSILVLGSGSECRDKFRELKRDETLFPGIAGTLDEVWGGGGPSNSSIS